MRSHRFLAVLQFAKIFDTNSEVTILHPEVKNEFFHHPAPFGLLTIMQDYPNQKHGHDPRKSGWFLGPERLNFNAGTMIQLNRKMGTRQGQQIQEK
jgi:hypothetical protein